MGVSSPPSSWFQRKRGPKTGGQSEGTKQYCANASLQDGGYSHTEKPPTSGGLVNEGGSENAYFTIPIRPEHRKYLRFSMADKSYQFTCLPFGLVLAPCVFTKTLRPVAALVQELGMRVIVYIDNILLMAESKEKLQDQSAGLIYLLECLGFTINQEKTVLQPSQSLVFLGFTVDTTPRWSSAYHRTKSRKSERKLENCWGRSLSPPTHFHDFLGKMNATTEVIPPAPLFFRHLQMDLAAALRAAAQDYETQLSLSPASREELIWWDTQMAKWNGKSVLIKDQPDLTIDSDASNLGWGVFCQEVSTRGPWSLQEKTRLINCLELIAATPALKTFVKNKTGLSVLSRIDNTTAVAYINNQGGTVSEELIHLTQDHWMWCLERSTHPRATPPWLLEHSGQQGVEVLTGQIRLEAGCEHFQKNQRDLWPSGGGLVCV